jgi:hypothetical protein
MKEVIRSRGRSPAENISPIVTKRARSMRLEAGYGFDLVKTSLEVP